MVTMFLEIKGTDMTFMSSMAAPIVLEGRAMVLM